MDYMFHCPINKAKGKYDMSYTPRTIQELKEWAEFNNLPLEDMRVFIGINYQYPKAFGIYKDPNTGEFIVYKNKADGSRSIRYSGSNEEIAVKELFFKMREMIRQQKANNAGSNNGNSVFSIICIVAPLLIMLSITICVCMLSQSKRIKGYYSYNQNYYYFSVHDLYEWSETLNSWIESDEDYDILDSDDIYFYGNNYKNDYEDYFSDFSDSEYYQLEKELYGDSDSNDDHWDSNQSWNDSLTDWDSDW